MTRDELIHLLSSLELDDFLDRYILNCDTELFPYTSTHFVANQLSTKFGVPESAIQIHVVGSAKLGLGIIEKVYRDGTRAERFRPFRPESDIDLAIVSPDLFEVIWDELSAYANKRPWFPWNSGLLGDYMVHGWLRPDKFPKNARLRRCDDWWDTFRKLSSRSDFGRRSIRGALYYSLEHLRRYQLRGLSECRSSIEVSS